MSEQSPVKKPDRNLRSMLPGIMISILAIVFLFRYFDWQDVLQALQNAEWMYLAIAVPIYLVSYVIRAMAWRMILKEAVSFRKVFLTMNMGYLLNNILPFRLGELGRAYLLGREEALGFWRVFSSILIERVFDMMLAVALLMSTLPFVFNTGNTRQVASMVGVVVLAGLVVLYLLARNRQWALAQFERFGERWPLVMRLGQERLDAFLEGLSALTSLRRFLGVFGLMIVSWMLAILVQYYILRSFYPGAQALHAGFSLGSSSLGVAVPSSPGYLGVYEAVVVGALSLFGIPASTAFAHAVTAHLLYFLVTGFFGIYTLITSDISLTEIFQRVRNINKQE